MGHRQGGEVFRLVTTAEARNSYPQSSLRGRVAKNILLLKIYFKNILSTKAYYAFV